MPNPGIPAARHSLPIAGAPVDRAPRRPRLAAALIPAILCLAALLGSTNSQAACSVPRMTLIAQCTDGLCTQGFLIRHVTAYLAFDECEPDRPVMTQFRPPWPRFSQMIEDINLPVTTGIYEFTILDRCYDRREDAATVIRNDERGTPCLKSEYVHQVSASDDRLIFDLARHLWMERERSEIRNARLDMFRHGVVGYVVWFIATVLALALPVTLAASARTRRGSLRRALIAGMTAQAITIGFTAWRASYHHLDLGLDGSQTMVNIDRVSIAILLLAMAIEAGIIWRRRLIGTVRDAHPASPG